MRDELRVKQRKELTGGDWSNLQGTSLHVAMFRNRMFIELPPRSGAEKNSILWAVSEWLREFCNSHWYLDDTNLCAYIEADADAVAFKLFFEGHSAIEIENAAKSFVQARNTRYPEMDFSGRSGAETAAEVVERIRRKMLYGDNA